MSKKGYYLNIERIKLRDLKAKERAEIQAEHDWWALSKHQRISRDELARMDRKERNLRILFWLTIAAFIWWGFI
jgi:hypothetical protein